MKKEPTEIVEAVREILISRRKALGMSHEKLSIAAGVSRSTISRIETNQTSLTLHNYLKVAEALEISLSEILKEAEID